MEIIKKICKKCGELREHHTYKICTKCYKPPNKICKKCNLSKPHEGKGLCKQCYRKENPQIDKNYYFRNKKTIMNKHKNYMEKYRIKPIEKMKTKARSKANDCIKKIKPCEKCGSKKNIQKHHEDYNKPLEVIFLCNQCHSKIRGFIITRKRGDQMKLEIINDGSEEKLQKRINLFIGNKKVFDIKFTQVVDNEIGVWTTAFILYEYYKEKAKKD